MPSSVKDVAGSTGPSVGNTVISLHLLVINIYDNIHGVLLSNQRPQLLMVLLQLPVSAIDHSMGSRRAEEHKMLDSLAFQFYLLPQSGNCACIQGVLLCRSYIQYTYNPLNISIKAYVLYSLLSNLKPGIQFCQSLRSDTLT